MKEIRYLVERTGKAVGSLRVNSDPYAHKDFVVRPSSIRGAPMGGLA